MDSKLRRTAILASMAVILLVSFLVLKANRENEESGSKTGGPRLSQTAEPHPEEDGAAGGQTGNDLSAFLWDNTFFDPEPEAADMKTNDLEK